MIRKEGAKYTLRSKSTGKSLGSYKTKAQAEKREKQVSWFKNKGKKK